MVIEIFMASKIMLMEFSLCCNIAQVRTVTGCTFQVLPPLCAELRNLVMQPMILPMVLTIAESQVFASYLFHVLSQV